MKNDISNYVKDVCKIGQESECCRYLVVSSKGFECAKITSLKDILDKRATSKEMNALGDNCKGYSIEESIKILNA